MTFAPPTDKDLNALLGDRAFAAWQRIVAHILSHYDGMTAVFANGRKAGVYEYKFQKSKKTLCGLYAREKSFGFMVIFGKPEREQFEAQRETFPASIRKIYDETHQYHDGKWCMFDVTDDLLFDHYVRLLSIKRKPSR